MLDSNYIFCQNLGSELVFIQNQEGEYLSFYWDKLQEYGLDDGDQQNTSSENKLIPANLETYNQILQRVIARRIPEKCNCIFQYQDQTFSFELMITPILPSQGEVKTVLVLGHLLNKNENGILANSPLPVNPDPSQKILTNIAQKIRRTLHLETIWQETVESLGDVLNLSRCLMISYNHELKILDIKAEYCQPSLKSILGYRLDLEDEPYFSQAISTRSPVIVDQFQEGKYQEKSVLLVSTFYQNQRNGLIALMQCDGYRIWSQTEIELVQELADQVGTAIAHATIYQELEEATFAAEQASRLKSEFLASTSHELRTPLNGIIGFLKLILDDMAEDPEEQKEFIEEAYKSAIHLLNLINDILDIAKIEAGKMSLELTSVDLQKLLKSLETFALPQAKNKNITFKLQHTQTLTPIVLYGNFQRLLQVLFNLVGNAIKFTHEGEITVSAEVVKKTIRRHQQEFPGMVKISVKDTGIGVPLEQQHLLFEKFFQVDGSRTKAYGGTGLGLSISKKLIEAMGGKISFYSMGEGLGSTVTFTVPLYHLPVMNTVNSENNVIEITEIESR